MPPKAKETKAGGKATKVTKSARAATAVTKGTKNKTDASPPNNKDKVNVRHRKKGGLWENINGNYDSCDDLMNGDQEVPKFIDYVSLEIVHLPLDWEKKGAADRAAKGTETIAQYAGCTDIEVQGISVDEMKALVALNNVEDDFGNEHGEFSTPIGQIPLSRLLELKPNLLHSYQGVLNSLFTLQCPSSSPWDMPFVRVISNHRYLKKEQTLKLRYYVYYTRLLFEMIADNEIKNLTDCLKRDLIEVIPVKKRPPQPVLFTSAADLPQSMDYRFSLAGLMRRIENRGYQLASSQPEALTVQLYDFQRSTYQWMLDQENDPNGINSLFWEEWKYGGNISLFYFPLAGEFRLTRPPKTNGGLLCEEMGYGKTIEIIALILGNPLVNDGENVTEAANPGDLPVAKGTLIVVPPTLLGQWFDEFRSKIKDIDTEHNPLKVVRLDGYHTNTLTTVQSCQVRRPASNDNTQPSLWGCEHDGSPIAPRRGEMVEVKLQHTLGDVVRILKHIPIFSL